MITITLIFLMAMSSEQPGHDAVAQVSGRTITRQEISARFALQNAAASHDQEQSRLDRLIAESLFEAAVQRAGVRATDEEVERDPRIRALTPENVAAIVEADRRWMHAALAVIDGEPLHSVYSRMIARNAAAGAGGEERLQRFVKMFDSREAVVRSLDRIDAGITREQMRADIRAAISRRHLLDYIAARAKAADVSHEQFAEEFWNQIIRETGTKILDPQYRLISWRELSWDVPNTTMH
jgi:hypothetical protein